MATGAKAQHGLDGQGEASPTHLWRLSMQQEALPPQVEGLGADLAGGQSSPSRGGCPPAAQQQARPLHQDGLVPTACGPIPTLRASKTGIDASHC